MTTVETAGRLLLSLAVVLGVIWVIARRARKGVGGIGGRNSRTIEVIERASLSRGSSVAVVRINDRAFVIGVAESQVSLLGETDLPAATRTSAAAAPAVTARAVSPRKATTKVLGRKPLAVVAPAVGEPVSAPRVDLATTGGTAKGTLTGSALSPKTWKQTIEALRDLTARV